MFRDAIQGARRRRRSRLDVAGGVAAVVCAFHCLLTPIIVAFAGLGIAAAVISERLERGFVVTSLVVGLASLGPAFLRIHRDPVPIALFMLGIGALLLTRGLHLPTAVERCIVPASALLIVAAHARNHRACARCPKCAPVSGRRPPEAAATDAAS
jgi:hypothetical protein